MTNFKQPRGMRAFLVVWAGQLVSILATRMSQFALTIWAFEQTQSATALGLVGVAFMVPLLVMSPIAGAMVDRHNRKLMMALSDIGAGLATVMIFILHSVGALRIEFLYVGAFISGIFESFQFPAYSASISLMVDKSQLGRVNGMMSLMDAAPGVIAPILAGALLPLIGLRGLLTFDIVTFVLAVGALMLVFVPQPPRTVEGTAVKGNLLAEAAYGFRYIFARPSLLALQLGFLFSNLFAGVVGTLTSPMILSRTANDAASLGGTQTAGAVGAILGGIVMSAWGGFKRRSFGVAVGFALGGLVEAALFGLGRGLPVWMAGSFLYAALIPLTNGSNQAIWQSKVAPDVQGRVFSARRLIAWITNPLTPLIAGPLADFVLEPAMRNPESGLARSLGGVFGVGPGAGMAVLIFVAGLLGALVGVLAWLARPFREAETLLPDALPAAAPTPQPSP